MELVYKNEKRLFAIMLTLSLLVWALLLIGTVGTVLVYALFFFLAYCFAQSALISYIKGTGVEITEEQFPELKRQIEQCSAKLGLDVEPQAYLLQMGGALNAFATRFLGRDFLVLYSDVVDGLADDPDALNFYIGHEIGHIKRKHLTWSTLLMPASVLPLVGAAYHRAREYTCDRHGLAACANPVSAEHGLAVLAAGPRQWRGMNKTAFIDQSLRHSDGFWMSFHELVGDYPWLVKRMAAVRALAAGREPEHPSRHFGAKLLALFVPRLPLGGGGAIAGIAVVGILAAVGIPAYQEYVHKSQARVAYVVGKNATVAVERYVAQHHALPPSLAEAGVQARPGGAVEELVLDSQNGDVTVKTKAGLLAFAPSLNEAKKVVWACSAQGFMPQALPPECR